MSNIVNFELIPDPGSYKTWEEYAYALKRTLADATAIDFAPLFQQPGGVLMPMQDKLREIVSVSDWHFTTDTDWTAAFQRALDRLNTLGGGTLIVPNVVTSLDCSSEIELPLVPLNFQGVGRPLIKQLTANKRLFWADIDVATSGLRFDSLRFEGPGSSSMFDTRIAGGGDIRSNAGLIDIWSTTHGYGSDIAVTRCEFFNAWSCLAVVRCFRFQALHNYMHNWMLYGVLASSSSFSKVEHNHFVDNDQTAPNNNAYACSATGNSAAGFPQEDFSFSFNYVENVPVWDGFMSHEGTNLRVCGNVMLNVRTGVDITSENGTITAPVVCDNDITSTQTDIWAGSGALYAAIAVRAEIGASSTAPNITGATVRNNIARSFGKVSGMTTGGSALGCFSLEGLDDAMIMDNRCLDFGAEVIAFRAYSLARPGRNITIKGNLCQGKYRRTEHMIVVDGACSKLSILDNTFDVTVDDDGSGQPLRPGNLIRFTSGVVDELAIRGNKGFSLRLPYEITGGATLDIHEGPGDFTPVLSFSGDNTGLVMHANTFGEFEMNNNRLTFTILIRLSSKGSVSGTAKITGLPRPAAPAGIAYVPIPAPYAEDMTIPDKIAGYIVTETDEIVLVEQDGNATPITDAAFTNSTILAVSGSYRVWEVQ